MVVPTTRTWRLVLDRLQTRTSSFDRALRADRFMAIPRRDGVRFRAGDPIAFVFDTDRTARHVVARGLHERSAIFVRATKRGHYAKLTLRILRRATGAIFVFTDAASMDRLLEAEPGLEPRAVLASRSLVDVGRPGVEAVGLRLTDRSGRTVPAPGTDQRILGSLTAWLGYPVMSEPVPKVPRRILLIDDPRWRPPSAPDRASTPADVGPIDDRAHLSGLHPHATVEVDGTSLRVGSGDRLAGRALWAFDLIVSRDELLVAYLQHWGLPAVRLLPDGTLADEVDYYALLPDMVASIRDSRLLNPRTKRPLDLPAFLLGREGPFGSWRRVAATIAACGAPPVERLRAMTLLIARRADPSLAAEAGDALRNLADKEVASRRQRNAVVRLLERLQRTGFVTEGGGQGMAPVLAAPAHKALPARSPSGIARMRAEAARRARDLGYRALRTAVRNLNRFPDPGALARVVALRGAERAFQYYVGYFRTSRAVERAVEGLAAQGVSPDPSQRIVLARLFMSIGRGEEAIGQLEGAGKLSANHHAIILTSFLKTGNLRAGLRWLERIDATSLRMAGVAIAAGNLLIADGQYARAREVVDAALAEGAKGNVLVLLAGKLAEREGSFAEALAIYGRLLANGMENVDLMQRWARMLRVTGRAPEVEHALRVRMANDETGRSGLLLSFLHVENGDLGGGLHAMVLAFNADPASPQLLSHLLAIAGAVGSAEIAVSAIERHAETSPDAAVRAATMLAGQGRAEAAVDRLETARRQGADRLEVALASARLKLNREDLPGAAREIEAVLRTDPVRFPALLLGVEIADRRGDEPAMEAYLDRARIIARGDYRVQTLWGRVKENRGDYAGAEANITRAQRARMPLSLHHDLRTSWHAFRLRAALGDAEGARDAYGDLVSALHDLLPPELERWRGEPLAGRSVLLMPRGGPGDEMRALQVVGRRLERAGAQVGFLGDARLEAMFHASFPGGQFVVNPLAGRKGARARLRGMPRLQSGTAEIARRLGVFVRAHTFERFDYVMFVDDVFHRDVLPRMLARERPEETIIAPVESDEARAREALDALPGDGPVVTVSWRGSYFSPNRPSEAFLRVSELGPVFAHRRLRFVDTHPNSSDDERAQVRERFGVELLRPPTIDFRNDLGAVGALMRMAAANVVPPVTQRDIAAGVGAPNIWSFDVMPGISESWRVDEATGSDLWQPGIRHHSVRQFADRSAVVRALSDRLAGL